MVQQIDPGDQAVKPGRVGDDGDQPAIEPRFQEHFVAAMAIPHKTAAYPNLAVAVTLPAVKEAGGGGGEGRRRRRAG